MLDMKVKMEGFAELFRAIGSKEIARHVGKCVKQAVDHGRDTMRGTLPNVLGRDVRGPGGAVGRFGQPTQRTINAIQSSQVNYDSYRSLNDIKGRVYVQGQQGRVGFDQSAYLKFQFGEGPQVRRPGDVGMDNTRILVPQGEALLLTQKVRINPYHVGGRQGPGILSKVKGRADKAPANFFESPAEKLATAMSQLAISNKSRRALGGGPTPTMFGINLKRQAALHGRGFVDRHVEANGFTHASVLKATQKYVKPKNSLPWWDVYEANDKRSGVPTYFARPPRVRDPNGGTHPIRRKSGKVGMMPNMITVAPEYGEAGPQVGPRILFYALREASYAPKLQGPWDTSMQAAVDYLDVAIRAELDHAIERKGQGRSF